MIKKVFNAGIFKYIMDFILSFLEVSIILAVFVWGEVLVRFLIGFTRWAGNLIGFGVFIFLILILSLFSREVAQFILNKFGENVAWIFL